MPNPWSSGSSLVGSSEIHSTSNWRLQTQRVDQLAAAHPSGRGYVIFSVHGQHLALGKTSIATDSPLAGESVLIFPQRAAAVIYATLLAWDDVMDGRALHQYRVRSVHYTEAQWTYTLQVVEGPVPCNLARVVEAKTILIRSRGNEKPRSTVLADPHAPPPVPRRLR